MAIHVRFPLLAGVSASFFKKVASSVNLYEIAGGIAASVQLSLSYALTNHKRKMLHRPFKI